MMIEHNFSLQQTHSPHPCNLSSCALLFLSACTHQVSIHSLPSPGACTKHRALLPFTPFVYTQLPSNGQHYLMQSLLRANTHSIVCRTYGGRRSTRLRRSLEKARRAYEKGLWRDSKNVDGGREKKRKATGQSSSVSLAQFFVVNLSDRLHRIESSLESTASVLSRPVNSTAPKQPFIFSAPIPYVHSQTYFTAPFPLSLNP